MSDVLLDAVTYALNGIATPAVDLYFDRMPDTPDVVIAVTRYPGRSGERIEEQPGIAYDYPRVQLMVRGLDPDEVYNRCQQAYLALSAYRTNGPISAFQPANTIGLIMRDSNDRVYYGVNFEARRNY